MIKITCALLIVCGTTIANAELINPSWLSNSMDGPSTTVASRLVQNGFTSSVGLLGLTGPEYGDQIDAELFEMCGERSMNWSVAWQAAGFGPYHRLGYYPANTPSQITWVIGGLSSGLPSSERVVVEGQFGLAFYSGSNRGVNSPIYYSQTDLNAQTTARDHLATLNMIRGESMMDRCGVIATWEDAFHIDHDYNDFGVSLEGARPANVPAPGALVALGLAGTLVARRRR